MSQTTKPIIADYRVDVDIVAASFLHGTSYIAAVGGLV